MLTRVILPVILFALVPAFAIASAGCSKKSSEPVAGETSGALAPRGPIESYESGTIQWEVKPDGGVRALVKTTDGTPVGPDVHATLLWKGPAGEKRVALAYDEPSGLLVGSGPKLESDLTEIRYTVTVGGRPWVGALYLPTGGTDQLEAAARRAARHPIPPGKVGPNGGVLQVVGDDTVEVVADRNNGQVRLYELDPSYKPIAIGPRRATLGLMGGDVEMLALAPGPGGMYFTGRLATRVDPVMMTIEVVNGDEIDAAIYGYEPGAVVVVGPAAQTIHLLVAVNWGVEVVGPRAPGVVVIEPEWGFEGPGWEGPGWAGHGHWGHGHGH
jgi:hypothetical protein